jgi:hypothetical protein
MSNIRAMSATVILFSAITIRYYTKSLNKKQYRGLDNIQCRIIIEVRENTMKVETHEVASFVDDFVKAHGKAPTQQVVADRFNVTRSAAAYHLAKLKTAPAMRGGQAVLATADGRAGRLESAAALAVSPEYPKARPRRGRKGAVMNRKEDEPTIKLVRTEPVVEPPVEVAVKKAVKRTSAAKKPTVKQASVAPSPDAPPRFLLAVIGFVGLGCAVMSAINTATFLVNSGRPAPLAVATSILTTLFSGAAFCIGALTVRQKIYTGILFYALAVGVIGFSVFSSVSVCYENMKSAEATSTEAQEFVEQTAALLAVNAQEQGIISANIADITTEREKLREEAEYWRNKSWAKHDDLQARQSAADQRITSERKRLGELLVEERALKTRGTQSAAASAKTVYTFLSGGDERVERGFRFAALAIPAVFFDLAAPLMLGVALLLLRKTAEAKAGGGKVSA